jgi:pimeloyl-ACP methyl ester carboxylesterase
MPFLAVDGRQVYYEIHGQGDPLVLLHHGFGSTQMWDELVPPLASAGWRVLLYDRRGYGRTEPGPDYRAFYESPDFRDYMVWEMGQVWDALGLESAHLAGQCEGGVTSVDFAAAHPGRVRSLVLGSVQTWSLKDMPRFNAEKFPKAWEELDPKLAAKFRKWHGEHWARELYEMARTQGGAYGTGYFDLRPRLARVEQPALVIYPDRSALFEVEQGVAMYRALARGQLAVMAKCGHNTYEQRPAEYLRLMTEFHQRLGAEVALDEAAAPAGRRLDPGLTCAG